MGWPPAATYLERKRSHGGTDPPRHHKGHIGVARDPARDGCEPQQTEQLRTRLAQAPDAQLKRRRWRERRSRTDDRRLRRRAAAFTRLQHRGPPPCKRAALHEKPEPARRAVTMRRSPCQSSSPCADRADAAAKQASEWGEQDSNLR